MGMPLRRILRVFYPEQFSDENEKLMGAGEVIKHRQWKWSAIFLPVILVILVTLFLVYYNTFLSMAYDVGEAEAQIGTQLQRRKNIILSMNVMVLDYAKHERDIFNHATDSRKDMLAPDKFPMRVVNVEITVETLESY